jgi:hypothetical protein
VSEAGNTCHRQEDQPPARPKPFLLWRALMLRSIARLLIWIVKTLRL